MNKRAETALVDLGAPVCDWCFYYSMGEDRRLAKWWRQADWPSHGCTACAFTRWFFAGERDWKRIAA